MSLYSRFRFLGVVLAIVFVTIPRIAAADGTAAADKTNDKATRFIENLANEAIDVLSRKDIPRNYRVKSFHKVLNKYFAVKTIGRWVVGRYWRRASDEDRTEFMKLFEDFIVETYVDRFSGYQGKNVLRVVKVFTSKSGDIIVQSRIKNLNGGPPINAAWRIRAKDGTFRVVDIMVEGISMGLTQRSEFASVIRRNGNGIKGLISILRKRLKKDVGSYHS